MHTDSFKKHVKNQRNFQRLNKKGNEDPKAMSVFWKILDLMGNQNGLAISFKSLANLFNVTERTMQKRINWLEKEGLVHILKTGITNIYLVNPDLMDKKLIDDKDIFKSLNIKVIINKKEQTRKIENLLFSDPKKHIHAYQIHLDDMIEEIKKENE